MTDIFDTEPQSANHFEKFWRAYPSTRKTNKKGCLEKWRAKRLDSKADTIIEDVIWRSKYHAPWVKDDGKYVPMPSTYLSQERWHDDREDIRDKSKKKPAQGESASRLAHDEVRRGVIACVLKRYPDESICRTFGISDAELDEVKRDNRAYDMPPKRPGDELFGL